MAVANHQRQDERVGYLDGIRGLAILLVVAGHIFYRYPIFKFGWIGLNLFFVLSGYLITQRLYVHYLENRGSYFRNFYVRRVLRIFPLYYGSLIFFFVLLPLFYTRYHSYFGELQKLQIWYWTYTSNWMIIFRGLPQQPLFFHFWSLAVEEQFYIVWPFLFLFLVRKRNPAALMIALIVGSAVLRNFGDNSNSYLNTGTAAEPLLLGALITVLTKQNKIEQAYKYFVILAICSIITLAVIFFHDPGLHISNNWLFHVGYSAIDLIWVYVLVLPALHKPMSRAVEKIFNAECLKWLGRYSYGIYVFHWLVLNLFIYKLVNELVNRGVNIQLAYFSVRIGGIALILAVSFLSYNMYEKKFLRLKRYFI